MFPELEKVTYDRWRRLLAHFHALVIIAGSFRDSTCRDLYLLSQLDKCKGQEDREMMSLGNHLYSLNVDICLYVQRSHTCRMQDDICILNHVKIADIYVFVIIHGVAAWIKLKCA